ncbi:hypothetical protein OG217_19430 [Streptomyces sp. NBC_01023]|uniref:hypothetical protein n=1 Tax=unclassified Streptomyces TaxID=2593676 RepID=UPI0030E4E32A|nr:hypothetical protein OG217_19430 [Streptomyces sp. NBC_01023]
MRRQHAAIAATATALCLGGLVAACAGGTAHHGYAAVGAAGPGQALTTPVPPSGKVTLTPLDGPGTAAGHGAGKIPGPGGSAAGEGAQSPSAPGGANSGHQPPDSAGTGTSGGPATSGASRTPGGPAGSEGPGGSDGSATPGAPGHTGGGSTSTPPTPGSGSGSSGGSGGGSGSTSPAPPAGPAVLKIVGALDRATTDKRWCEKVTVRFSNTGGAPVASGTVTFSTHIIGGLGVDWATRTSTQPLPGPIAAGAAKSKTYTVCVDDWRVPLGMHIETRKASVSWK